MNLSQALTKVRNLKSKLSRTEKLILAGAVHYEDRNPECFYLDELDVRAKLIKELRSLRTRIQKTNVQTKVVWGKEEVTLAELILINADIRSHMAFLNSQLELSTEEDAGWRSKPRTKDDVVKVFADGFSKEELREELSVYEVLKENMDSLMASVNNSTELVSD